MRNPEQLERLTKLEGRLTGQLDQVESTLREYVREIKAAADANEGASALIAHAKLGQALALVGLAGVKAQSYALAALGVDVPPALGG